MSKTTLTIEQAATLLTKLGAKDIAIVAEAEEGTPAPDIDQLVSDLTPEPAQGDVDKDKFNEAISREFGKKMGALRSLLAQAFSIKRADLEGLEQDELIPKLKSIIDSRYTQTEADLRQQLEDATNEYNRLEEKLTKEWQKKLDDAEDRFEERDIRDRFETLLNTIPRTGGDIKKQAELMLREARSNYIVKRNPVTGQVEFFDKNNPEQKILEGKNPLKDEDFGNKFVDNLGIRVKDTRHVNPNDVDHNTPKGIKDIDDTEKTPMQKFADKINAQLEAGQ